MSLFDSPTYRRSLAERLAREREQKNDGTIGGGLASMVDAATAAYLNIRDEGDQARAGEALVEGLTKPVAIDENDEMQPGIGAARLRLSGMEGNPYAGRLSQMLAMSELEEGREAAAMNAQRQWQMQREADQRAYQDRVRGEEQNFQRQMFDRQMASRPGPQRRIVQGRDGRNYWVDSGEPVLPNEGPAPERGPLVTVSPGAPNNPLLETLAKKEGEIWSSYLEQGAKANDMMTDFSKLDELAGKVPSGPVLGRAAEQFPEIDQNATQFVAIVSRIAPTLRVPGSGATSDKDVGFIIDGLPKLRNYPEANKEIVGMFRAKARIDLQRAAIISAAANGEITPQGARAEINRLNQISILPPALQQILGDNRARGGIGGIQPAGDAPPAGVPAETWRYLTPEQKALWR
jgi:hypothetical protein